MKDIYENSKSFFFGFLIGSIGSYYFLFRNRPVVVDWHLYLAIGFLKIFIGAIFGIVGGLVFAMVNYFYKNNIQNKSHGKSKKTKTKTSKGEDKNKAA